MLILTVLQGPDKGKKYELPDHEPQLIGRSSEALPLSDGRWWFRLYDSPLSAASPLCRSTQQAVFDYWHLPLLARRQGPSFGYWDRKGRR